MNRPTDTRSMIPLPDRWRPSDWVTILMWMRLKLVKTRWLRPSTRRRPLKMRTCGSSILQRKARMWLIADCFIDNGNGRLNQIEPWPNSPRAERYYFRSILVQSIQEWFQWSVFPNWNYVLINVHTCHPIHVRTESKAPRGFSSILWRQFSGTVIKAAIIAAYRRWPRNSCLLIWKLVCYWFERCIPMTIVVDECMVDTHQQMESKPLVKTAMSQEKLQNYRAWMSRPRMPWKSPQNRGAFFQLVFRNTVFFSSRTNSSSLGSYLSSSPSSSSISEFVWDRALFSSV
jgi:hypothetical protein